MKDNILFLDFDGPLFPDVVIKFHPFNRLEYPGNERFPGDITYWKMSEVSVEMFNMLNDRFKFKTVVSSTWKRFIGKVQTEELFEMNGLRLQLHDDWSTKDLRAIARMDDYYRCLRSTEIKEWIDRQKVEKYLIVDDPWSGSSLDVDGTIPKHTIVMVNPDVGPSTDDYNAMHNIMRQW